MSKVLLIDRAGTPVHRIPSERAHSLLAAGEAHGVRWSADGKLRTIRLDAPDDGRWGGHASARSQVHNHETETNPRGVWTFRRVDLRTEEEKCQQQLAA